MQMNTVDAQQYQVTPQQQVLSVKDWLITLIILAIPLVNIIMLFVWAFGGGANLNKANYAKAALLLAVIVLGLYLIIGVLIVGAIFSALQ